MSNRQQVLDLPELLENILIQLPIRDLLFAQKVCKDWQQAIAASPKIQEALFFRQDRVNHGSSFNNGHKGATANPKSAVAGNPLLMATYAYYNSEDETWEPLDNFGKLVEGFKAQVKGSGYDRHDEFEDVHCVAKLEDGGCFMTCHEA
ncbi:hypothetical protein LTR97_005605 [Elasticomyces elasticus]|uniref:F-box domain-containing protein n=1 Tax=Elasticomyces elasticus TaxID=574655 RepID=A0AAN7VS86_9PEZI|nr:hypothetical protein LTR97_005605 [Elasticomyces elasticus]